MQSVITPLICSNTGNQMFLNPWVDKVLTSPKYVSIKILQVHWCSQYYLEFNLTSSLFYLFDWKFEDLMFFPFSDCKTCAPEKLGAPRRFCAADRVRARKLSWPVWVNLLGTSSLFQCFFAWKFGACSNLFQRIVYFRDQGSIFFPCFETNTYYRIMKAFLSKKVSFTITKTETLKIQRNWFILLFEGGEEGVTNFVLLKTL